MNEETANSIARGWMEGRAQEEIDRHFPVLVDALIFLAPDFSNKMFDRNVEGPPGFPRLIGIAEDCIYALDIQRADEASLSVGCAAHPLDDASDWLVSCNHTRVYESSGRRQMLHNWTFRNGERFRLDIQSERDHDPTQTTDSLEENFARTLAARLGWSLPSLPASQD